MSFKCCIPLISNRLLGAACFLAVAFAFYAQYGLGQIPCVYCIYQRYLLILAAFLLSVAPRRTGLGFLVLTLSFAFSVYQMGLEHALWSDVLKQCTVPFDVGEHVSRDSLKSMIYEAPLARCDRVNWVIFGMSAVTWTVLLNGLLLVSFWMNNRRKG